MKRIPEPTAGNQSTPPTDVARITREQDDKSRDTPERVALLARALLLEYVTVGWNVAEGAIAVVVARTAGSVALLVFGVDSFVESVSALVLAWRLRAELHRNAGSDPEAAERVETRARRCVGASLLVLTVLVVMDAARALWTRVKPETRTLGIAVTVASLVVMLWLAQAKRGLAAKLRSRALKADAAQTAACWWLSTTTLIGVFLNALFGWWWADPCAALVMTYFLGREGLEAWRGDACCARPSAGAAGDGASEAGCSGRARGLTDISR